MTATPTFKDNGKRRVKCANCGHFLGRKKSGVIVTRLTDNKEKVYTCYNCHELLIVFPPQRNTNEKGEKVIMWGPQRAYTTADLTSSEIENTVPLED